MSRTPPSGVAKCPACGTFNGKHSAGCSAGFPPVDEVAVLRAKIALMRETGVLEADGIKLGPVPQPPKKELTEEQWKELQAKNAQRMHEILFAHSGTRPRLRLAPKGTK